MDLKNKLFNLFTLVLMVMAFFAPKSASAETVRKVPGIVEVAYATSSISLEFVKVSAGERPASAEAVVQLYGLAYREATGKTLTLETLQELAPNGTIPKCLEKGKFVTVTVEKWNSTDCLARSLGLLEGSAGRITIPALPILRPPEIWSLVQKVRTAQQSGDKSRLDSSTVALLNHLGVQLPAPAAQPPLPPVPTKPLPAPSSSSDPTASKPPPAVLTASPIVAAAPVATNSSNPGLVVPAKKMDWGPVWAWILAASAVILAAVAIREGVKLGVRGLRKRVQDLETAKVPMEQRLKSLEAFQFQAEPQLGLLGNRVLALEGEVGGLKEQMNVVTEVIISLVHLFGLNPLRFQSESGVVRWDLAANEISQQVNRLATSVSASADWASLPKVPGGQETLIWYEQIKVTARKLSGEVVSERGRTKLVQAAKERLEHHVQSLRMDLDVVGTGLRTLVKRAPMLPSAREMLRIPEVQEALSLLNESGEPPPEGRPETSNAEVKFTDLEDLVDKKR